MNSSQISLSVFNTERMRHVVGVGSCSAYHIRVSPGDTIGTLGAVEIPAAAQAMNNGEFDLPRRTGIFARVRELVIS
jgi:hypothetical protein